MKTKKIKQPYTLTEGLAWLLECSQAFDKDNTCIYSMQGEKIINPYFTCLPRSYEIAIKPKFVPYSDKDKAHVFEKSRTLGIVRKTLNSDFYAVTYICNHGLIMGVSSSEDWPDLFEDYVWTDGSTCGMEVES